MTKDRHADININQQQHETRTSNLVDTPKPNQPRTGDNSHHHPTTPHPHTNTITIDDSSKAAPLTALYHSYGHYIATQNSIMVDNEKSNVEPKPKTSQEEREAEQKAAKEQLQMILDSSR